jgi:predicted Fe-Mo cluster-binding NifX family protein
MNARISVPYDDGAVSRHFGKSSVFKIYTIEDNAVTGSEIVESGDIGHEELGLWMLQRTVNAVLCGDIGPGAHGALAAAGIHVLSGVEGDADEAVARLLDGTLSVRRDATCNCRGSCGGSGSCSGGCGCSRH